MGTLEGKGGQGAKHSIAQPYSAGGREGRGARSGAGKGGGQGAGRGKGPGDSPGDRIKSSESSPGAGAAGDDLRPCPALSPLRQGSVMLYTP